MKLEGKNAIVTGSSSGIGRAIAIAFAKEGANVTVNYSMSESKAREVAKIISKMGRKVVNVKADVSNAVQVSQLVDKSLGSFHQIDILVNNAGILLRKKLTETSEEEWDRVIDVNLKGIFLCSKYVIPQMIKNGGGTIVNIASVLGTVGAPNRAAYCAAKGGVVTLTKQMAIDYGQNNIRINCICPGGVETEIVKEFYSQIMNPEPLRTSLEQLHAIGRLGKPEEIAEAAVFLASGESSFVTGAILLVDGGWATGNFAGLQERIRKGEIEY